MAAPPFELDRWTAAVIERQLARLARPEFLKAVRALSVRYVERRASLADRSPLDSAGKRAAFAGFFAPLHFVTMLRILEALRPMLARTDRIIDLGCGTGVAGGAWALTAGASVSLTGVDQHPWVLEEARWNWRAMGLRGRVVRGDLVRTVQRLAAEPASVRFDRTAIVMGWSMNELDEAERRAVQTALGELVARGAQALVIEPIAKRLVPWWDEWAARMTAAGGRANDWRFDTTLPPALAALDEAAGFGRDALTARSVLASPQKWTRPR